MIDQILIVLLGLNAENVAGKERAKDAGKEAGKRMRLLNSQSGFSLLELLVVLGIMAVLVATAVPQYKSYRQRAYDFRAETDARNVALAEEAYYLDKESYLACEGSECVQLPSVKSLSPGVIISVAINGENFKVTAYHPKGSGKKYVWDSELGQMQTVAEGSLG